MSSQLTAVSPLDGRYGSSTKPLGEYFSEMALMRYRLKIEIEYLISISNERTIYELPLFSKRQLKQLRNIYEKFDKSDAQKIKTIETQTNHDVKAVEYFIHSKVKKTLYPWVHFPLTSEEVNNMAYSLMWKDGIKQDY